MRPSPHHLLTAGIIAVVIGAGCGNDEPAGPGDPIPVAGAPQPVPEPAFTPGNANTITWSGPGGSTGLVYRVQRTAEADFTVVAEETPWSTATSHTFTGLQDGVAQHYRIQARSPAGGLSAWSPVVMSTQDATPPVSRVTVPDSTQTSLLFELEVTASDATSGVDSVTVWVRAPDEEYAVVGTFVPGPVSYTADGGGRHDFHAVATDRAGNTQAAPDTAQATTEVPEPIILVDNGGFAWDITNAVLAHQLHLPWWDHGLGRFTIRPVIDPTFVGPGEVGYPLPDNIADIIAVNFDGDVRAYKVGDIANREVVNDVVGGRPIAATY